MIATRETRLRVRSRITLGTALLIALTSVQSAEAKQESGSASRLSIDDVQIVEGTSGTAQALVPIRLDKAVGQVVTVDVATVAGAATAGSDYSTVSTRAVFNRRQTVAYLAIPILTDAIDEPNEQFTAVLSSPAGASIGDATGVITIIDDDEPAPPPPPPPAQTDLRLVLTDDEFADQLLTGDDVRYTLAVNNLGPVAATGVTVVDRLPDGLVFRSADPACAVASDGETVTCSRTSPLGPSESWAPAIVATILVNDMVVNTAQVTSSTPDSNGANNSDSELTTSVTPNAHVKVAAMTVVGNPTAGWFGVGDVVDVESTYVVTVYLENSGPTRADGVVVELYDEELWSVLGSSCPSAPTEVENGPPAAVACTVGSMAVGETRMVTYDLSFNHTYYSPNTPGAPPYWYDSRLLAADVRSATPGQADGQVDGTKGYIVANEGEAWIEPSFTAAASSVPVGSELNISGRLRNLGPWFLAGIGFNVSFPADVQFGQVDGPVTCGPPQQGSLGDTVVFCTHDGNINAGAVSGLVTFRFRPTTPGAKSVGIYVYDDRNIADGPAGQSVGFTARIV